MTARWNEPRPKPNVGFVRERITNELIDLLGDQYVRASHAYGPAWLWRDRFFAWAHIHRESLVAGKGAPT